MNPTAVASISLGILLIATRGPFVVAPDETVRVFLSAIENTTMIRAMACGLGLAAFATLRATATPTTLLSGVLRFVAWWLVGNAGFLWIFPGFYQQIAGSVLRAMPADLLRVAGVLGVTIGGLFVYYGAKEARAST